MPTATITEADVDGFRDKLERWGSTLTPGEQAVLHLVVLRAFPTGSEVEPDVPEVEGFTRDVSTGRATGRRQHADIHFTKLMDKASPMLVGLPYPPMMPIPTHPDAGSPT